MVSFIDQHRAEYGVEPICEQLPISPALSLLRLNENCLRESRGDSVKHSAWAKAHYASQRAKGKDHAAAVRSLAFKWIRIIWKCWQTNTPYDEAIYLACLKKRNSPLMKLIEAQTEAAQA